MSDPWETLAAKLPSQNEEEEGQWPQSDEWAQSKKKTIDTPPWTRSTRGSPNRNYNRNRAASPSSPPRRNYNRNRARSPSSSPPRNRQYNGRERSPWRELDRETSRTFRGDSYRDRAASRTFRGQSSRDRAASRSIRDRDGSRMYREASRSFNRRPDFSVSPRNRNNRVERRSRSISPDNHIRRNRGRSPVRRDETKENSNRPGASWTKNVSDRWGPDCQNVDQSEDGSLSPWSKAAKDIERNYNRKKVDGWGPSQSQSQSGLDPWKQNANSNMRSRDRDISRDRTISRERDRSFCRDGDRRERNSPELRRRGFRDREKREASEEKNKVKPYNNEQNGILPSWEGPKWRDWSKNALQNSIKDISWDFKLDTIIENNNNNNNNNNSDDNNNNNSDDNNNISINEEVVENPLSECLKPNDDENEKFTRNPSGNENLQNDHPEYPQLLYDPWDSDSKMPLKVIKIQSGYESSVENPIKPPEIEKLENNPELIDPNPNAIKPPNRIAINSNPIDPNPIGINSNPIDPNLNAISNSNWENSAQKSSSNRGKNPSNLGGNNAPNSSNFEGNNASNSSNRKSNSSNRGRNNAPNSSNFGGNATNQSNWCIGVPISSNWVGNNVTNSSNFGNGVVPISSNRVRNAPNSSNRANNLPNSSNLGSNNVPNSTNRANNLPNSSNSLPNNAPNSSNWANNLPNSSNSVITSSSNRPNKKPNKAQSPIKPPGFENLQNDPSKPPGFENTPKTPKSNKKSNCINENISIDALNAPSIFKLAIRDFAEEKIEPFYSKGLISGRLLSILMNKFVVKVVIGVGPGAANTEVLVQNFIRDQNAKLTRLACEYLALHVDRKIVQEILGSGR